jgi:hypothetical protein
MNIVPNELTTKIEVDLGHGYCLSKTQNIIKNPVKSFHESHVLKMIEEQRPELLVASESVYICGETLQRTIELVEEKKRLDLEKFNQQYQGCYSYEPCQS